MRRILIKPENENNRNGRIETVLPSGDIWDRIIIKAEELQEMIQKDELRDSRILLAVQLDDTGINLEIIRMLSLMRRYRGKYQEECREKSQEEYREKPQEECREKPQEECREKTAGCMEGSAGCMEGSAGCILVDGTSELYTKALCRDLAFAMNCCGCLLPGKPAVEATGSLKNYMVRARNSGRSLEEEYAICVQEMLERLWTIDLPATRISLNEDHIFTESRKFIRLPLAAGAENISAGNTTDTPASISAGKGKAAVSKNTFGSLQLLQRKRLLCLHASEYRTSNTLQLWTMVRKALEPYVDIEEISLRNGEIKDCGGCPFRMCMHFSSKNSCYYGGPIPEKVYPALEACDALLILSPNYNDAVSANISAFINRLTALFRRRPFYEKYLYAIVVSGYSGSDIVAGQLLDSLTLNKTFRLPPYFALMETANDPGSIAKVPDIVGKAENFAERILAVLYR